MKKKKMKKKIRKILYQQLKLLIKESRAAVDGNDLSAINRAVVEIVDRLN